MTLSWWVVIKVLVVVGPCKFIFSVKFCDIGLRWLLCTTMSKCVWTKVNKIKRKLKTRQNLKENFDYCYAIVCVVIAGISSSKQCLIFCVPFWSEFYLTEKNKCMKCWLLCISLQFVCSTDLKKIKRKKKAQYLIEYK